MLKVCLVEDEFFIRRGLIHSIDWLALNCIVIGEADNGRDGLQLIEESKLDIIITDINMPILNGLDMLKNIKEHHNIKAIILTGHDEFEYAKEAIKLGICEYLLKPIKHEELFSAIRRAEHELEMKRIYEKNIESKYDKLGILPSYTKAEALIVKLCDYLEQHYQSKLSAHDVAGYLQISVSQLNLKLKTSCNMTFIEFLTRYRIQKSIAMLKETDYPVYEISYLCGFSEYKYFSQVFKKFVGVKPTELKGFI